MQKVYDCIADSTKKLTWVSSGTVPSQISCALRMTNSAQTLISSMAASTSGNGFYYGVLMHPGSAGKWVINEWIAVINANTYVNRQFGKLLFPQVA
jgi:hypothetical protein